MTQRVLIAMSGGVDSSLAAALLREQGCEVEGVTMKLSAGVCCDIASAMAVCERLGIVHRVIDAQDLFSREIIGNFISEYQRGRTPNPCVRCNELVKFSLLLDYAQSHGFDFLATGHYARIEPGAGAGLPRLLKGVDAGKDQSYFLYRLGQEQLKHILFPLGGLHKSAVRIMAAERSLPAAERPESQEVCFIPGNDYRSFLKEHAPQLLVPGELALKDGSLVGRHEGIAFFTVGQRRKLGVSAGERLYVLRIEQESRRVVLGTKNDLLRSRMTAGDARFLSFAGPVGTLDVEVKIRYRAPAAAAGIEPLEGNRVQVTFREPVAGVSPGQSAVFYQGDVVVGGGIIEKD